MKVAEVSKNMICVNVYYWEMIMRGRVVFLCTVFVYIATRRHANTNMFH